MKGKILGFSERDGGAISAEDGSRYKFTAADWRGERPPTPGLAVDFESHGAAASEVYPVSGAAMAALGNLNVDLTSLSTSPGGARVGALFTQSLALPFALLLLAACLLTAISSPAQSYSLLGLGEAADTIRVPSAMAARMMGERGGSGLGALEALLVLRFAAPLAALWLIWAAWQGRKERMPMLAAGASAILAGILVFLFRSAVLSAIPSFARAQMGSVISIGMGTWLLLLVGAALIAAGLGILRNPLAQVAGDAAQS